MKTKLFIPLKLKQICLTPQSKNNKIKYNTIHNAHVIENKMSQLILNKHNPPTVYLHFKLSRKYIFHPKDYTIKQINQLLNGQKCHLVALFKDHMVYDFKGEFLRRKYNKSESHKKLINFPDYYHKYLIYFCKPIFTNLKINRLIHRHYEKKAEYYYNNNCRDGASASNNNNNKPDALTTIFSSKIKQEISQRSISISNIFQTNFEYNNQKGKALKTKFVSSVNTCSLIIKNHHINHNNLYTEMTHHSNNDINYNYNGNESLAKLLNHIEIPANKDNSIENNNNNYDLNPNKNTITITHSNTNTNNNTDKSSKKFEPFSLRNQHIKLQSVVFNNAFHHHNNNKTNHYNTNNNNNNNLSINKHLNIKSPKNDTTLHRIISQKAIQKKTTKDQPKLCLEFNQNINTIRTGPNRIVLPRTQSTTNIMKVSLVIYTNQNGRNKDKIPYQQPNSEYGISSPTFNNFNINIHNKFNLSPQPTVSFHKKGFNFNSNNNIQENQPFSTKTTTLKNRKEIELLKIPQLNNNFRMFDHNNHHKRVLGKNTRVKSEKNIFDENKYEHLRFNSDPQCERSVMKKIINIHSNSKEKNKHNGGQMTCKNNNKRFKFKVKNGQKC